MLCKIIVTCTEIERIRALAILASLPEGEERVFNRYVVKAMASPCLMLREVASSIPIINWDGVKIGLIDLLLDGIAEGRCGSPLELHSLLLHLRSTEFYSVGRSLVNYILSSDTGISFIRMCSSSSIYSDLKSLLLNDPTPLTSPSTLSGLNDYTIWSKMSSSSNTTSLTSMLLTAKASALGSPLTTDFIDQRINTSNRVKLGPAKAAVYYDLKNEIISWKGPEEDLNVTEEYYVVEYKGKEEAEWISLPRCNGSIAFLEEGKHVVRLSEGGVVETIVRPVKMWLKSLGLKVKVTKEGGGRGRRLIVKKVERVEGDERLYRCEEMDEVFEVASGAEGVVQRVVNTRS
ncbi:hypothetical protein TrVE_jg10527 [Triparma verrucosa]|uniref:Uncharacterized protein n=1 Tax=Triparma verrucosa TaxID=1606542 RepID=A0A9W7KX83_9STRA|nr:hypothetical protein TrVE_jg10527 [Triparma verrucosa]